MILISELGLPKEAVCDALATIENNIATQTYLRRSMRASVNYLTRLSNKMVKEIEEESGVRIEESNSLYDANKYKLKKETLIAFYAQRPWLLYNNNKPHDSIMEWFDIYRTVYQVEVNQINFGKTLVIKADGSIELE